MIIKLKKKMTKYMTDWNNEVFEDFCEVTTDQILYNPQYMKSEIFFKFILKNFNITAKALYKWNSLNFQASLSRPTPLQFSPQNFLKTPYIF